VAALGSRSVGWDGGGAIFVGRPLGLIVVHHHGHHVLTQRFYRTIRPDAEKALAAGSATVCGEKKQALQTEEDGLLHAIAGNLLEIQVSAGGAMHEKYVRNGRFPGKKTAIAGAATPWPQIHERNKEVHNAAAVRPIGPIALATWADHCKGARSGPGPSVSRDYSIRAASRNCARFPLTANSKRTIGGSIPYRRLRLPVAGDGGDDVGEGVEVASVNHLRGRM